MNPAAGGRYALPVAMKAVLWWDDRLVLMRARTGAWGLPGGRLRPAEEPLDCLVREVAEELGWQVVPRRTLGSWVNRLPPDGPVFTVCVEVHHSGTTAPVLSAEHLAYGLFRHGEVDRLNLAEAYRAAIGLSRPPAS